MTERQIQIRVATVMLLLTFILIFAVQNIKFVELQLFSLTIFAPRSVLVFSILAMGIYIGWNLRSLYRYFSNG